MSRDLTTIADMIEASRRAREFVSGYDFPRFAADVKTQSAVLHQLAIIGEAVTRLSAAFRDAHDDVPWHSIVGMRNQLIHGYHDVDLEEVWQTVERDLPALQRKLEVLAR